MSKCLQVLMDEAEWVRNALRRARCTCPHARNEQKLRALDRSITYAFPTSDIDQMLGEIERGYGSGIH